MVDDRAAILYIEDMIDYKKLATNHEEILAVINRRGGNNSERVDSIRTALDQLRDINLTLQEFKTSANDNARKVANALALNLDIATFVEDGHQLKGQIDQITKLEAVTRSNLGEAVGWIPNLLDNAVPSGHTGNQIVKVWGDPETKFMAHYEYSDIERARSDSNKITKGRFATLRGDLARLHRAIGQFMLDHNTEHGYVEVNPPVIVEQKSLFNTGQLPKFREDLFTVGEGSYLLKDTLYLAPTAEVMLTNLYEDYMLVPEELPVRVTALTKCFRKEAGSAGRDTRGLIRMNEFEKVELVSVVYPEDGHDELERMTSVAESILEALVLPYRRVLLCAGDTGFSAAMTYDLEVWMAGAGTYREISSCSLCSDFQARRANIRVRYSDKKKVLAHTLNGSALAVGRTLAAIIENYQEAGGVVVPEVLCPYMRGTEWIAMT